MTREEELINERLAAAIENYLLSNTSPQDDDGEEYFSEQEIQEINKQFSKVVAKFLNWPATKRKSVVAYAEKECHRSNSKCDEDTLELFRLLSEEADRRDGERRGA